ncbi:MAG: porin, partial [Sulfurifustis sp.]
KSDSAKNLTARWVSGPLLAGASWWDYAIEGSGGDVKEQAQRAWAGFTFPFGLFVGLAYDQSKLKTTAGDLKRTSWMVPVNYTLGNNKFYVTYATAGDLDGTSDTGANAYTVGWDYAFSKRTSAGVYYSKIDNDIAASYNMFAVSVAGTATGGSAATLGQDPKIIYFGVAHNF